MAHVMPACRLIDYFAAAIGLSAPQRARSLILFMLRLSFYLCYVYVFIIIGKLLSNAVSRINEYIYIDVFFLPQFYGLCPVVADPIQYHTNIIIRSNMWRLCRPNVRVQDRVIEIIMFTSSFCGRRIEEVGLGWGVVR